MSRKYNFKEVTPLRSGSHYCGFSLKKKIANFSIPLQQMMQAKDATRLNLYIDKTIKAVKMVISDTGSYKLHKSGKGISSTAMSTEMPEGRYLLAEEKDNELIFEYEK